MRAILEKGDNTDLRIGAGASAGRGTAECSLVRLIVGDIERADADPPPLAMPGAGT
jgi:hypothetical protein